MTSPGYDQARVERRRREHERQAVVFGVLIAFLAVCGIFALAVYSGAISSPFNRPFTTVGVAEQETYPVPCLPPIKGQLDLETLLAEDSTFYGDLFAHVVKWQGDLYLEDGLHRAVRAALQQRQVLHARVLELD